LTKFQPDLKLPALLRLPYQSLMRRILAGAEAKGYGDVRLAHFPVLQPLFFEAAGLTATELAVRAGVSKQAIAKVIDELTRLGYVERAQETEDRRAHPIRLTRRGRRASTVLRSVAQQAEHTCASAMGRKRFALMKTLLAELGAVRQP
jgi:DNA-binding MarR family transcriptional regulator